MSGSAGSKTWVEISKSALLHNADAVRRLVAPAEVMAVVKANAYGHGLLEVAQAIGRRVDWFGVDNVDEALRLRQAGMKKRILILGYTRFDRLADAIKHDISFVAYHLETLKEAAKHATMRHPARIHLKLETGLTRQGVSIADVKPLLVFLKKHRKIMVEGTSTHFANIEDTTDHHYAASQLVKFNQLLDLFRGEGLDPPWKHTACSAATILFPETRFNLIRLGISLYGLWSSGKTEASAKKHSIKLSLEPALSWKTIVAQIKHIPAGTPVGYGLFERVKRDSKIAVLPVGYYDGYDRVGMSGKAHVLIHGKRCKILGRICMNMCMADVTDVKGVQVEDQVVLIGQQGNEIVSAEEFAEHMGSINYEVVTRINPLIPRVQVD